MIKLKEEEIKQKLDKLKNKIEQIMKSEQFELLPAIAHEVMSLLLIYFYVEKMITKEVIKNHQKGVDIPEIVEDTLVNSVQKVRDKILNKTYEGGDLAAFTIGIARNQLRKRWEKKHHLLSDLSQIEIEDETPNFEHRKIEIETAIEKSNKFQVLLSTCLSEKQINLLIAKKVHKKTHEEIKSEFGFASVGSSKDAVSTSATKLKNCIKENPIYKEWLSDYSIFKK